MAVVTFSLGYAPARTTTTAGGWRTPRLTALRTVTMHPALLPDTALWRHKRGVLEAISILRDPGSVPSWDAAHARAYWQERVRHYRRLHSQAVRQIMAAAR